MLDNKYHTQKDFHLCAFYSDEGNVNNSKIIDHKDHIRHVLHSCTFHEHATFVFAQTIFQKLSTQKVFCSCAFHNVYITFLVIQTTCYKRRIHKGLHLNVFCNDYKIGIYSQTFLSKHCS